MKSVILFGLFYSQISPYSQSKYPNFDKTFSQSQKKTIVLWI